jgi:hypothetical protein
MLGSSHKISDDDILAKVVDYVQEPTLTDRERKIGVMAKAELEKKHYSVAVIQRVMASLQHEAMRTQSLTLVANTFYHDLDGILHDIAPIGTNFAAMTIQGGYLD